MSSSLSALQLAALQEMGITVWSTQSHSKESFADTAFSAPKNSPTTPTANLTQLRSIISAKQDAQREEKAFPTDALERFAQFVEDVEQAMAERTKSDSKIKWLLGDSVCLTGTSICLPVLPSELSTKLKRQLWQKIHQLNREN
ncbi:hypothetical protein [Alteromonas sp. ASW11-130]|uniref:hypothetical protein n=1 Tax=Alteromonas sp. ASW11-130 TaxID=3015775 RepID=UPI0022418725|nr:hypothetical protein [Alteromonas sp. ASW11-130]MCW8093135.1 hypothetical protein [Alteromonas sp. ASW11-130]